MVQLPSVLIENSHPPLESGTELQSQHLLREDPMELSRGRISHLISSLISLSSFSLYGRGQKKAKWSGGWCLAKQSCVIRTNEET